VLLASIIVQLAETTVYSLHCIGTFHIQIIIVPKTDTQTHAVASFAYCITAACSIVNLHHLAWPLGQRLNPITQLSIPQEA